MKMPGQMPNMGPNMMPMRMMGGPGPGMNMNSGASNNSMPQGWQGPGTPGMAGQMPPSSQGGPANSKATMQKQSPNSPHPEGSGGPAGAGNMPNMSRMQADGSPGMPQQGGSQKEMPHARYSNPATGGEQTGGPPMAPNMPRGNMRGGQQFPAGMSGPGGMQGQMGPQVSKKWLKSHQVDCCKKQKGTKNVVHCIGPALQCFQVLSDTFN